jgi:hypothetical protein
MSAQSIKHSWLWLSDNCTAHARAYLKYSTLTLCARDDVLFEHLDNVKRVREGDDSVEVGVVEMKSTR